MLPQHFLLGITGGVAAYKSCELVRLLVKAGHCVDVVMSDAACHFVTPTTFQALSGRPVYTDLWDNRVKNGMSHIELTRRADAYLIAPASADIIARITHGLCNDLISTLAAARTCPLIIAPAMNRQMWENPANQRNIAQLQHDGVSVYGPAAGEQACGEVGEGRMLEAEELADLLIGFSVPRSLQGRRVLLTAGPTYEAIDPVRGITNRSSGKMGYALAQACRDAGASVTLISGPTALACPTQVIRQVVDSARDMQHAVEQALPGQDIFIAVAAVADYHVVNAAPQKLKKTGTPPTLNLKENPDILASIAAKPAAPFCVGFAAESHDVLAHAVQKRLRKNIPLLVANRAQSTMGFDDTEITLIDDVATHPLPRMKKRDAANAIVAHLAHLFLSYRPH